MLALLLLMSPAVGDDVARFRLPSPKPALRCITGACAPKRRREDYRIPDEPDPLAQTSKDRAFAADGTKCSVVGDKRCPVRGRTIFTTDFSE
ncbi:hypothetical protein FHT00_002535 [Sphingomonas insulae]|uniref:Secreted protein n=1 Tax=Sphingomonas insulae TaxID=424800 RepID=A0ABN1I0Y0_9SPHN|nr:hypothetical protein [Sphingomonas insulae]NIJ30564.1 hypothetical protein [Sphingomonas insulae]